MDVNKLMVDDWVLVKGKPTKVDTIEGYVGINIEWICGCEYGGCERQEDIEPIPLTSEILEKNGLNKGTLGCSDRVCYSFIDGAYQLALVQELPSYHCNIRTVSSLVNINIPIRYVHELQQALRLAGIDKEIVL